MAPRCYIRAGAFGAHVFPKQEGGYIWSLEMARRGGFIFQGVIIGGGVILSKGHLKLDYYRVSLFLCFFSFFFRFLFLVL